MNVSIFYSLLLTSLFIPSMITKLLPFIVFISSMWFMLKIRNNEIYPLKIWFSNIKIFFILASVSFSWMDNFDFWNTFDLFNGKIL